MADVPAARYRIWRSAEASISPHRAGRKHPTHSVIPSTPHTAGADRMTRCRQAYGSLATTPTSRRRSCSPTPRSILPSRSNTRQPAPPCQTRHDTHLGRRRWRARGGPEVPHWGQDSLPTLNPTTGDTLRREPDPEVSTPLLFGFHRRRFIACSPVPSVAALAESDGLKSTIPATHSL